MRDRGNRRTLHRMIAHSTIVRQSVQIAAPQSAHSATAGLPQHTYVAVTGYIRSGRMNSCDEMVDLQVALHPTAEIKIVAMPKRNLRVTKWVVTIPVVGVCTFCDRLFNVPVTALKRVGYARDSF
jgi:hypothetical protein